MSAPKGPYSWLVRSRYHHSCRAGSAAPDAQPLGKGGASAFGTSASRSSAAVAVGAHSSASGGMKAGMPGGLTMPSPPRHAGTSRGGLSMSEAAAATAGGAAAASLVGPAAFKCACCRAAFVANHSDSRHTGKVSTAGVEAAPAGEAAAAPEVGAAAAPLPLPRRLAIAGNHKPSRNVTLAKFLSTSQAKASFSTFCADGGLSNAPRKGFTSSP